MEEMVEEEKGKGVGSVGGGKYPEIRRPGKTQDTISQWRTTADCARRRGTNHELR
jgi:hypothetical protein